MLLGEYPLQGLAVEITKKYQSVDTVGITRIMERKCTDNKIHDDVPLRVIYVPGLKEDDLYYTETDQRK